MSNTNHLTVEQINHFTGLKFTCLEDFLYVLPITELKLAYKREMLDIFEPIGNESKTTVHLTLEDLKVKHSYPNNGSYYDLRYNKLKRGFELPETIRHLLGQHYPEGILISKSTCKLRCLKDSLEDQLINHTHYTTIFHVTRVKPHSKLPTYTFIIEIDYGQSYLVVSNGYVITQINRSHCHGQVWYDMIFCQCSRAHGIVTTTGKIDDPSSGQRPRWITREIRYHINGHKWPMSTYHNDLRGFLSRNTPLLPELIPLVLAYFPLDD